MLSPDYWEHVATPVSKVKLFPNPWLGTNISPVVWMSLQSIAWNFRIFSSTREKPWPLPVTPETPRDPAIPFACGRRSGSLRQTSRNPSAAPLRRRRKEAGRGRSGRPFLGPKGKPHGLKPSENETFTKKNENFPIDSWLWKAHLKRRWASNSYISMKNYNGVRPYHEDAKTVGESLWASPCVASHGRWQC